MFGKLAAAARKQAEKHRHDNVGSVLGSGILHELGNQKVICLPGLIHSVPGFSVQRQHVGRQAGVK
ncbi:hypothetical protein SAMN05192560_0602 [Methylobacillus rhizosphaerae]|uniref:Uncharacterized protein n=1 Tax=Methylobacillus rhizosphaerae TaxID=551994 RepID=A0A238YH26_9PROT|nr:hypothetical protein SAMN05192560_0602 [Methylobacillus rhizosphaerae]